jgi:uncharacterized protein
MTNPFRPGVGAVFSADIAVPEHEREVRFYSRVLATGDAPLWRDDLMNNMGIPIIGLGERGPEYADLPLQWMPHVQVADVAASVQRALDLGGSELMHARDDDGTSQWAVVLDPAGAAFGLIPVIPREALPPDPAPSPDAAAPPGEGAPSPADGTPSPGAAAPVGRIAWLDLTVPDAAAVRDFYRQVVGWSVEDVDMTDDGARYADYNMLGEDGSPAAGICHARGVNAGLPPVWLIYLPVGDLAGSLRRVEEEGGRIIRTVPGQDGEPAYATIQDPVGSYFALAQA